MKQLLHLLSLSVLAVGLSGCPQGDEQSSTETTTTETTTTASAVASAAATTAPASPAAQNLKGDPAKGPALIASKTCGTCHTIKGVTAATGTIGPTLDGIGTRAATRVKGQDAEAYLRQSIEQPQAFVVPDYQPVMPALRTTMSDQEYADLIAYLLSLKS